MLYSATVPPAEGLGNATAKQVPILLNFIEIDIGPRDDDVSRCSHSGTLLMVYLNAKTCRNKSSELNDLVTDHDIDVLLLTETWLKEQGDEAQKAEMTAAGYKTDV